MNDFEKYFEYHSFEQSVGSWKERFDGFLAKLQAELCEFFFSYWPEMQSYKESIFNEVQQLAIYPGQEAYQAYLKANINLNKGVRPVCDCNVPKKKSRNEEEKSLKKLLTEFPALKDNKEFIQSYWVNFEEDLKYDNFFFGVHNKIKGVLVEYYLRGITELESEHLRELDSDLYYLSSHEFSVQALKIKIRIEEQSNNQ